VDNALPYLSGLIIVALTFDFLNGLHDAANSIATIVSTRVLSPKYAVFWAAFFNSVAFLVFGLNVAHTVGTGIVTADIIDDHVIFGALMGAISWNLLTWALGIPSSSSHALIAVVWSGLLKTGSAVVFSPALGRPGSDPGSRGIMDFRTEDSTCGRQNLSLVTIRLRLALFARPRWQ
jgi:PiT family inorganic phosphate transporter